MVNDFLRGLLRDDAEPRLHPRQRRLEAEIFLHAVRVGEHAPHRLGGEDVAEYGNRSRSQSWSPAWLQFSQWLKFVKVIRSLRAKRYTRRKEYGFKQSSA